MKCSCCNRTGVMLAVLDGRFLCYYGCDHTSPLIITPPEKNDVENDDEEYSGTPMAYWDSGSD